MTVKIKFRPTFKIPMLCRVKTMTSRTKKMGEPGDRFEAFGYWFEITHVMRITVGHMIADCFKQEGCKSVQELIDLWREIHPKVGVVPDQVVWAHIFKRID